MTTRAPLNDPTLVEVRMPKLADTVIEGVVARWLKAVGDSIEAGESMASVETDKASVELPAPVDGVIAELLVAEGEIVPVDAVIARIAVSQAPTSAIPTPAPVALRPELAAAHAGSEPDLPSLPPEPAAPRSMKAVSRVFPATMRASVDPEVPELPPLAVELRAAVSRSSVSLPTSMRRAIAEHMTRARATIPQGQSVVDADLTRLAAARDRHKVSFQAREGVPLTYTACFVAALARALRRLAPDLRSPPPIRDGAPSIDIGVAVAVEAGLLVPVIRSAGVLSLGETARALGDLVERSRLGKLGLDETRGAWMSITNVGSFGNLTAFPIVPVGQAALLAPGAVVPRLVPAEAGGVRPASRCLLALVFDRRIFSDIEADALLHAVAEELDHLAAALGAG